MIVEFLESAYFEYLEAIEYYNLETKDLGNRFIIEVDKVISIITKYPESFSKYTKHTRKAVLNKFPYNIIYAFEEDTIIVVAVAHQHRKPNYWAKRK